MIRSTKLTTPTAAETPKSNSTSEAAEDLVSDIHATSHSIDVVNLTNTPAENERTLNKRKLAEDEDEDEDDKVEQPQKRSKHRGWWDEILSYDDDLDIVDVHIRKGMALLRKRHTVWITVELDKVYVCDGENKFLEDVQRCIELREGEHEFMAWISAKRSRQDAYDSSFHDIDQSVTDAQPDID
jgi:hypothetical protein